MIRTLRQPRNLTGSGHSVAEFSECGQRGRTLVVGNRSARTDDRLLVALPGEEHDVAGARPLERCGDRGGTVGDEEEVVAATLAGRLCAAGDLVENCLAVLAAGVLVGRDYEAGSLGGDRGPSSAASRRPAPLPTRTRR